jgi:hypothetical protein
MIGLPPFSNFQHQLPTPSADDIAGAGSTEPPLSLERTPSVPNNDLIVGPSGNCNFGTADICGDRFGISSKGQQPPMKVRFKTLSSLFIF